MTKAGLPQGTLDLLILKVLAGGPLHGYAIAQRLEQVSKNVLRPQQGTLYPALHRLERRRCLTATWKRPPNGRETKTYRLTAKGRAELIREQRGWHELIKAIGRILRLPEGRPT